MYDCDLQIHRHICLGWYACILSNPCPKAHANASSCHFIALLASPDLRNSNHFLALNYPFFSFTFPSLFVCMIDPYVIKYMWNMTISCQGCVSNVRICWIKQVRQLVTARLLRKKRGGDANYRSCKWLMMVMMMAVALHPQPPFSFCIEFLCMSLTPHWFYLQDVY